MNDVSRLPLPVRTPDWHYQQAALLLEGIVEDKNKPEFTMEAANVYAQSAQAHALMGLLSHVMDRDG